MNYSPRFRSRAIHHTLLFAATAVLLATLFYIIPGDDHKYLWSMATGYVSLILLSVTLLLGPLNIYRRKLNPVSSDLRRDMGIWSGLLGIAHIVVGIQVHMGNVWLYFFRAVEGPGAYDLRSDLFGAANYTGMAAGVVAAILLGLSNDMSLKWLGSKQWKSWQRLSYVYFSLLVAHGVMYQMIEKRQVWIIVLFGVIVLTTMAVQLGGVVRVRASRTPVKK